MEHKTQASSEADVRRILTEISVAYLEVLSGLRRPEQLARWVSDKFYAELTQRCRLECRSRQLTGLTKRPTLQLISSSSFPTSSGGAQLVSLVRITGRIVAVSLVAAQLHGRLRVTEIDIVSSR